MGAKRQTTGVRIGLAVVVAAAVAASGMAVAAGAGARTRLPSVPKIYTYKATFTGSGSFSQKYTAPGGTETITASFHWDTTFPKLVFIASKQKGSGEAGGGEASAGSSFGGNWSTEIQNQDGDNCSGSGGLTGGTAAPAVAEASSNPLVKGGFVVVLRPISSYPMETSQGANDCADIGGDQPSDFWQDWPYKDGVAQTDDAPFKADVSLTPAKEGKVVQHVSADSSEMPKSDCGTTPSVGVTCTVTYDWSGEVTLKRLSSKG